jgi:hypothetical protein
LSGYSADERELFIRFTASAVRFYRDAGKTVWIRVPDILDAQRTMEVRDRSGVDSPILEFLAVVDPVRPSAGEAVLFLSAPLERRDAPAPVDLLDVFRQWASARAVA